MQVLDDLIVSIYKFYQSYIISKCSFSMVLAQPNVSFDGHIQMKVCDGDFFFIVLFLQGWMKKGDKNQVTGKDLNRFKSFLATTNTFLNYE